MISALYRQRSLIWAFADRDFATRYRSSVLGWAWSLIQPLATLVIFAGVFSVVFKIQPPPLGNGNGGSYAAFLFTAFNAHEKQAKYLMEQQLALPAYEQVLKAAHSFNLLDARGAISVTERAAYIGRIRNLARAVAQSYYESRERLGFPMAPREWVAQMAKKAA